MNNERLREILYFFRLHAVALLLVTLPFAVAATLSVQLFGEPVIFDKDQPAAVQWQSALALCVLYPLALGVKTLAVHHLAEGNPLAVRGLLVDALRLWPSLAAISLLAGLFVGSVTMMSLGLGIELLQGLGLLKGIGAGLLFLFALPGIYLYARIGCATVIATTEQLPALAALSAAWRRSQAQHAVMFSTLLILLGVLMTALVLVFGLLGALGGDDAAGTSAGIDLLVRGVSEWLFCLLTIAFYRFWSLLPHID